MAEAGSHQALPVSVPIVGDGLASATIRATQNDTIDNYNAHDEDAAIHNNIGLLSARPAASAVPGAMYLATDTLQIAFSDGAVWNALDYSNGTPVPNQSDMLFLATIYR